MATKKTAEKTTTKARHVLVATSSRPWTVLAGTLESDDGAGRYVLRDARMIVYWSSDAHGLLGVAAGGPGTDARVSPRVDRVCVRGVEIDADLSAIALRAIEAEPWH